MKYLFFSLLVLFGWQKMASQSLLVETELFQDKGGWSVDAQFIDQMGSPFLLAHGLGKPVEDARTSVRFPRTGKYYFWVRTRDWAPYPKGPGKFQVILDGKCAGTFGTSGLHGWQWYEGGSIVVSKREMEIRLKDLTGFDGRCDAVFFSMSPPVLPEDVRSLEAFRKKHLNIDMHDEGHYDLVVVGGGVAGICTAVQAARLGLKVALINNRPVLGGNSSSEVRVSMDGDVFQNKYPSLGRIVREIDSHGESADRLRKQVVLNESNLFLFENMHVCKVTKAGNSIKSVIAVNINDLQEHLFSSGLFADCTGDATLGLLAGADIRYGRESRKKTGEKDAPETSDNLVMGSSNQWHAGYHDSLTSFPVEEWMLPFSAGYHFDLIHSVWNWESGFNNLHTVYQAEEIRDLNFRAIYGNWAYLKTYKPEKYGHYQIDFLSFITGKRESFRLMGDLVLNRKDIEEKVDYPDAVVTTTWGIDIHYPDTLNSQRFPREEFIAHAEHPLKQQDVYTLPYRCLYSYNIDNLFMAGRNISVTHIALGAFRVQKCTGMMGEVIGMAAFICKKYNILPRQVYTERLTELKNLIAQPNPCSADFAVQQSKKIIIYNKIKFGL
jgi:hypothetical protein